MRLVVVWMLGGGGGWFEKSWMGRRSDGLCRCDILLGWSFLVVSHEVIGQVRRETPCNSVR